MHTIKDLGLSLEVRLWLPSEKHKPKHTSHIERKFDLGLWNLSTRKSAIMRLLNALIALATAGLASAQVVCPADSIVPACVGQDYTSHSKNGNFPKVDIWISNVVSYGNDQYAVTISYKPVDSSQVLPMGALSELKLLYSINHKFYSTNDKIYEIDQVEHIDYTILLTLPADSQNEVTMMCGWTLQFDWCGVGITEEGAAACKDWTFGYSYDYHLTCNANDQGDGPLYKWPKDCVGSVPAATTGYQFACSETSAITAGLFTTPGAAASTKQLSSTSTTAISSSAAPTTTSSFTSKTSSHTTATSSAVFETSTFSSSTSTKTSTSTSSELKSSSKTSDSASSSKISASASSSKASATASSSKTSASASSSKTSASASSSKASATASATTSDPSDPSSVAPSGGVVCPADSIIPACVGQDYTSHSKNGNFPKVDLWISNVVSYGNDEYAITISYKPVNSSQVLPIGALSELKLLDSINHKFYSTNNKIYEIDQVEYIDYTVILTIPANSQNEVTMMCGWTLQFDWCGVGITEEGAAACKDWTFGYSYDYHLTCDANNQGDGPLYKWPKDCAGSIAPASSGYQFPCTETNRITFTESTTIAPASSVVPYPAQSSTVTSTSSSEVSKSSSVASSSSSATTESKTASSSVSSESKITSSSKIAASSSSTAAQSKSASSSKSESSVKSSSTSVSKSESDPASSSSASHKESSSASVSDSTSIVKPSSKVSSSSKPTSSAVSSSASVESSSFSTIAPASSFVSASGSSSSSVA
ncbi:hypothetical protein WICPIJ_000811, partial [Wickerhamomyces pijperi]